MYEIVLTRRYVWKIKSTDPQACNGWLRCDDVCDELIQAIFRCYNVV